MHLRSIRLYNFRNHSERKLQFSEQVNCIVGENGSGKTNLLDAIYMLALTKSAVQKKDQLSIRHGEALMVVEGEFFKEEVETINLSLKDGQRKVLLTDGKAYEKLAQHIGKFPLVLIAPDDTDMIRDASDTRRKLFDSMMSQFDGDFLSAYQRYNRQLEQRNQLLKQFAERQYFDQKLLDSYSQSLVELAMEIAEKRTHFIAEIEPLVKMHYQEISGGKEVVGISYETEVGSDFPKVFRNAQRTDVAAQRTTLGIHKDDFSFLFDEKPFKKFGSQGQRKSFVLAMKLAHFELLEKQKGFKPILLLDDIFDKLDDARIAQLIAKIETKQFGQIFISDARPERTAKFLSEVGVDVRFFEL
ncbi:DNA replication and repair protein RecF [Marinilongibacter aquaticus]|uniref:DNA replication/repair protein RecF n=1 Tax=Marinilongibacter aquaticus TaxID=2975157 RepID=UPI0021BD83B4|nr:DNA replication and repair protein RecF [Marinilongibacter aquaticus]UBM57432.1 DNA replication and repair protein RecF [Marinilongibacter aquaticus]